MASSFGGGAYRPTFGGRVQVATGFSSVGSRGTGGSENGGIRVCAYGAA